MKKVMSFLLVVMMVISISACGGNEATTDTDTGSSITQNQTDVPDTSSTEQNADTSSSTTSKPTTTTKPEPSKPSTTKPEPSKPTTTKPETSKPTTTKPETSKPTTTKPETSKPTTTKPETSQPTTTKPETSKPTTTKPETSQPTTTKPETSKPTTTKPETSKPSTSIHTHNFSTATCTAPAKCSCGATNGSALGHKWQEATCKAPKTCSVCKTTEGNLGNHNYTNGKCNYCNKQQIINPKTGLKKGADYYQVSADGDGHYTLTIWQFDGTIICPKSPNGVYSTNEEWKSSDEIISYKGKKYYPVGSGGPLPRYYLTDTEIILDYKNEPELLEDPFYANAEYKLIVNYEYDLEVVYSSDDGMFKKGTILDLVE